MVSNSSRGARTGGAEGKWSDEISQAGNKDTRLILLPRGVFLFFKLYDNTIGLKFCHFNHFPTALVEECLAEAFKFHFGHQSKKNQSNLEIETPNLI